MESKAEAVARLRREAKELRGQAARLLATASARDHEADRLQDAGFDGSFADLTHSDAVHSVLSSAGRQMSPAEIHEALEEGGRNDSYASLGGILQGLKRQERIDNPARARWVALV